jgi:hypothetical protein
MPDENSRLIFIERIKQEIQQIALTKKTLSIVMGLTAIEEKELEKWIAQIYAQIKAGHISTIERTTSKNLVTLIKEYQEH